MNDVGKSGAALERGIHDGISYLRRAGDAGGLPMVMLHGIGSNAASYAPLIGALDNSQQTILAWDAPGYGTSEPFKIDAPMPENYAAAVERLMDGLGIARAVIVGHSLGTLMAARFGATRPQRAAAVVLLSPALGFGLPAGAPLPQSVQARIDDFERLGPQGLAAARASRLVHEPERHADVVELMRAAMAEVRMPGYAQACRMLAHANILGDAAALGVPTLVMCAVQDTITPPDHAKRIAAGLPPAARAWERRSRPDRRCRPHAAAGEAA